MARNVPPAGQYEAAVVARQARAAWPEHLIYALAGGIGLLLATRVLLKALGATPANGFTGVVYQLSHPFVAPFATMATPIGLGTTAVLEVASVLAIPIYVLIAWLIVRLEVRPFLRRMSRWAARPGATTPAAHAPGA